MSARTVEVAMPPDAAWQRLRTVAASLGKVEEANDTTRYVVFKARYGLNPVRLRVSVLSSPSPDRAVLDISARGQDVMGVASRKVIDRLCAQM